MGVGLVVFALLITLMQGVFCQTWDVMVPASIEGIHGSCVTIPCHFQVPRAQEKNMINCSNAGIWNAGNIAGPAVITGKNLYSQNTLKGKIDGDLTKQNCTTTLDDFPEDFSDTLFFRVDCSKYIRFTFKKGVEITVKPGPSPPQVTIDEVVEGHQVKMQCSVPVPCFTLPPALTWSPQKNSWQVQTQMQQDKDGNMTMVSTLTFTASADHHNKAISCSVSYPLTQGGSTVPVSNTQRLQVLYAPRHTVATLNTTGPVSAGRIVIFTCSSDANEPVRLYTWYRVRTVNLTKRAEGEFLVMKVSQRDSGAYLCEAESLRGSQRSIPVILEVIATAERSDSTVQTFYILCGLMTVLLLLTVAVGVYKYQSLSRRLKQVELKGEHTYTDLRIYSVASDYDELQLRQPKAMPPPDVPNYENLQKYPSKPLSKISSQSGPEVTG